MKCCPQCEQLNESSQIYCEICSTRLVNQLKPRRRINLSSERTVESLEVDDEEMKLRPLLILITITTLVGTSVAYGNKVWSNGQKYKKDLSEAVQSLKELQLTGSQKKIK